MATSTPTSTKLRRGDARWFFGQLIIVRATAEDTGGLYSLLEVHAPAGLEAPLHVHYAEDEGFLILDGDVTFNVGGKTIEAGPGDFLFGERGVPHSFKIGERDVLMLWTMTPSGFEDLVAAASVPAEDLIHPPAWVTPPENVAEIVASFGNQLL